MPSQWTASNTEWRPACAAWATIPCTMQDAPLREMAGLPGSQKTAHHKEGWNMWGTVGVATNDWLLYLQHLMTRFYTVAIKCLDAETYIYIALAQALYEMQSESDMIIGLFKMFSRWIWGIFNIQIQSDRGHKLILFRVQNKDKDLLSIY